MLRIAPPALCCLFIAFVCALASESFGKAEEWQDLQGNKFTGEPSELMGPIAVFRTGRTTGRRVTLQLLGPQDCVRLHAALQTKPARADKWANATGETTHELIGRLMQVDHDKLVRVDLTARPEPAVLVVIYSANAERFSWDMLTDLVPLFTKLREDYPGMVEGVMYGVRHTQSEHLNMAVSRNVPWLVTDFYEQGMMDSLNRFLPDTYSIMVLSRNGVPLFSADHPDAAALKHLFADLSGFLDLARPENPKTWGACGYYWSVVQPIVFARGHAGPVLVGNPLMKQGLVQRKVYRFEAELHVRADGKVSEVTVMPDDLLPEKMAAPVADALKNAVFVPAVQDGNFVDGVYLYHFRATL